MVNRGEEKVRVHMNVVPRSTENVGSIPTEVKRFFSLPRVVTCFSFVTELLYVVVLCVFSMATRYVTISSIRYLFLF